MKITFYEKVQLAVHIERRGRFNRPHPRWHRKKARNANC